MVVPGDTDGAPGPTESCSACLLGERAHNVGQLCPQLLFLSHPVDFRMEGVCPAPPALTDPAFPKPWPTLPLFLPLTSDLQPLSRVPPLQTLARLSALRDNFLSSAHVRELTQALPTPPAPEPVTLPSEPWPSPKTTPEAGHSLSLGSAPSVQSDPQPQVPPRVQDCAVSLACSVLRCPWPVPIWTLASLPQGLTACAGSSPTSTSPRSALTCPHALEPSPKHQP